MSVDIKGDAEQDLVFQQALQRLPFKEGDILNHGTYEEFKARLNDLFLIRGYFDARMTEHMIHVYPDQQAADIHIRINSARRYRFGRVVYGDMPEATRLLVESMINFNRGEAYRAGQLSALNRDLSATNYFNQIDIHPQREQSSNLQIPIFIGVLPKTAHKIETGIGYSTDEGPRLSLGWDKPWFNDRGHSITNRIATSRVRQKSAVVTAYRQDIP